MITVHDKSYTLNDELHVPCLYIPSNILIGSMQRRSMPRWLTCTLYFYYFNHILSPLPTSFLWCVLFIHDFLCECIVFTCQQFHGKDLMCMEMIGKSVTQSFSTLFFMLSLHCSHMASAVQKDPR